MPIVVPNLRMQSTASPPGVAGRIVGTIFFFVFFGMGVLFCVLVIREAQKNSVMRSWPSVPCRIIESAVIDHGQQAKYKSPYVFIVRYRYEAGGAQRTGQVYSSGYNGSDDYTKEFRVQQKYPLGSGATCLVNPQNPADAVLAAGSSWILLMLPLPLLFVAIGGGGMYAMWRAAGPKPATTTDWTGGGSGGPISSTRGGMIFFAIFFLAGAGVLFPVFVSPLLRTIKARSWPQAPATVISSHVQSHRGDKSTTYSPDILYRYTVDGKEYRSNHYDIMGGSSSGGGASETVHEYPAGKKPMCYVNPSDPADAVLDRGFSKIFLFALIPLVFMGVGAGGMIYVRRAARGPSSGMLTKQAARESALMAAVPNGPFTPRTSQTPLTAFIFAIVFTVFWNGLLSVFLYELYQSYRHGKPDVCLTVFLTPFVLVGLGAFFGIFYTALALLNPRPTITLGSGSIPLGGSTELKWQFRGRSERITKLKVHLEAREEATYRRGTSSYTDKQTFHQADLLETTRPQEIASGRVVVKIPLYSMHSFEARSNKIIWTVTICGEIPKWPDVKQEFKLTITPAAQQEIA